MSNKMSECCTCGKTWRTGFDGSHSCTATLVEENKKLRVKIEELENENLELFDQISMMGDC
jgi:hypothetical protein